jgi:hypothetical protein
MLEIDREAAIPIALELGQHRRVDQIPIDRVRHELTRREPVHRERPEGVRWGESSWREAQRVAIRRSVEASSSRVDQIRGRVRLFLRAAVNAVRRAACGRGRCSSGARVLNTSALVRSPVAVCFREHGTRAMPPPCRPDCLAHFGDMNENGSKVTCGPTPISANRAMRSNSERCVGQRLKRSSEC